MKLRVGIVTIVCLSGICISMHTGAVNWKMVRQGEEFETGDRAITEFVDIDSIQKTDRVTKKALVRLFDERGKETYYMVLFTQNGIMRITGCNPPDSTSNNDWQLIEPGSYWEKAYFEVWSEKERGDPSKKKSNKGKPKRKFNARKIIGDVFGRVEH